MKHAYSLLGYKHSEENIAKFKLKKISEEHKELLSSEALPPPLHSLSPKGRKWSEGFIQEKMLVRKLPLREGTLPKGTQGGPPNPPLGDRGRDKLSLATANYKKNNPLTAEALANIRAKTIEREGVAVTVLNTQTNEVKSFTNQTEAGLFLGISRQAIYNAIRRGKPVKGIYLISK